MANDLLTEQFSACYDDDGWFVSLRNALAGLTAEQAAWKPDGADNSIWEEVNHIYFWNDRWLQRYRGELNEAQDVENKTTFLSGETDWKKTLEKLYAAMEEWRVNLIEISDEKLASAVNDDYQAPWSSPLGHQNIHNAYHIGQIVLLRKLQGSWDSSKGVS